MEDLIASLEEQLRQQQPPPSPGTLARHASSAAEIDNETLRDQVQHLQKKISSLEDLLEDARMTAEREEAAVRDRMKRYKERDETTRKEVVDTRKEVERVLKAEEAARARVEEIEEALRENTVALENARAEVEGLRMEVAVSFGCGCHAYVSFVPTWSRRTWKDLLQGQTEIAQPGAIVLNCSRKSLNSSCSWLNTVIMVPVGRLLLSLISKRLPVSLLRRQR